MAERPLLASLLTQVDGDEDRVVAYADSGPVTLPSFRHQVQCWQAALVATPGSRVALYHEDSLTFAAALFGAWHAGKQVLLPADALPNSLERAAGQVDCFIGDLPGAVPINFQAAPAALRRLSALDPKLTSLVLFTSGSSGEPVAISKALPQLQSELSALELCFGERLSETVIFGSVSHQHLYGLLFRILWPLAYRRPFYARRLCTPEQIAALPGTAPAVLVASPAQLKRLPKSLDWQAVRSRMRVVFSSGGPLPAAANDAVEQLWRCPPIEIFGSTETGGIASRQGADNPWSALPGVQWRIVDELLAVRSAHLPNAEWQSTTDRAEAVGAGFQLRGRSDRIAKIEETRVSLSAIEQALLASGLVEAAKVTVLNEQRAMIAAVAAWRRYRRSASGFFANACAPHWRIGLTQSPCQGAGVLSTLCRSMHRPKPPRRCWRRCSSHGCQRSIGWFGTLTARRWSSASVPNWRASTATFRRCRYCRVWH